MPDIGPIHVVDDDEAVRDSVSVLLRIDFVDVRTYASCREFLGGFEPGDGGCLILDLQMPDIDGFGLMEMLADRGIRIPTILITASGDPKIRRRADELGVIALLDKPCRYTDLREALDRALAGPTE